MNDGDILLVTALFAEEIKQRHAIERTPCEIDEMVNWWKTDDCHPGPGCIDLCLDRFISGDESAKFFVKLLEKLEIRLAAAGKSLPSEYVNEVVGLRTYWFDDQDTSRIITCIREIRDLVLRSVDVA